MYLTSNHIFTIRNETIYNKAFLREAKTGMPETKAIETLRKPTAFILCV